MTAAAQAAPRTNGNTAGAIVVLGIIAITVIPLPAAALDLFLATSLAVSLLVFMLAIYVERPLDFSAFPSLLLLITLFRLALNVATTRRILLHGSEGVEAAGGVIRTFGEFAVGGNFIVGAVVFLILVIVNFVVITKGAERISEVSARFTLDSMPGKQMAIDADLGAGLINEHEARARRKGVEQEADFYGAMDGASKFVRGDAIAAILITAINVVGGIIVGTAQQGMPLSDAAHTFTLLTIGDGLVSQIPALLVSTGSALLTTRGANTGNFGSSLGDQLFSRSRPLGVASAAIGCLALVPGMPHFSLLALAGGVGLLASGAGKRDAEPAAATPAGEDRRPNDPSAQKAELEAMLPLDLLSLEVGLDLLSMVDAGRNGELLARIASVRKQLALELGIIVPPLLVRDDLRLRPGGYRILISGGKVAQGEIKVGRLLAIDPSGQATRGINGDKVREPTFGLPALWILPADRARAEGAGAAVVDAAAVVATHLTEVIRRHAHELLGRREAQELFEIAGKHSAKVIEELVPHLMPFGEVLKVLRGLLQEGVSIRDIRAILEALADHATQTKETGELVELVRQRLARQLTCSQLGEDGVLRAAILDPRAEELLRQGGRGADPQALSRLAKSLETAAQEASERDEPPVLLVAPDVRRAAAAIAARHAPGLAVLSYRELDSSVPLVTSGVVGAKELSA